ncbi:MAG: S1C family serine protease, partial [Actinomycetes bacterium]
RGSGMPVGVFAAPMVERARPSVVRVGRDGRGAGVIWSRDGLVLTNHHVVFGERRSGHRGRRPDGKLLVTLGDGRALTPEVVGRDRALDLALLKVGATDLAAAPVGDSASLRVGEMVFAIGHPWGLLGTVTAGIVSGTGEVPGSGAGADYVQSDVALAPGNSGGPLLNARGEVVGINAMIFGGTSLAVPSNAASAWVARVTDTGRRRPRLGAELIPAAVGSGRDGRRGFVVFAVAPGGPAERAGMLVGDVILGFEDKPVESVGGLVEGLARAGVADRAARLRVMRGGKISVVEVCLKVSGPGRAA